LANLTDQSGCKELTELGVAGVDRRAERPELGLDFVIGLLRYAQLPAHLADGWVHDVFLALQASGWSLSSTD
jgi:hypothetical protein